MSLRIGASEAGSEPIYQRLGWNTENPNSLVMWHWHHFWLGVTRMVSEQVKIVDMANFLLKDQVGIKGFGRNYNVSWLRVPWLVLKTKEYAKLKKKHKKNITLGANWALPSVLRTIPEMLTSPSTWPWGLVSGLSLDWATQPRLTKISCPLSDQCQVTNSFLFCWLFTIKIGYKVCL